METTQGILLNSHFINKMTVGGKTAWFTKEINESTGHKWRFKPDNSGVYEMFEEILLHPSVTGATGVPGMILWKFKGINKGKGSLMFELLPPGQSQVIETVIVNVEVA